MMMSWPAFSADYSGVIRGNRGLVWTNAAYDNSHNAIFPTAWTLANERTTSEWYPGTFFNEASEVVKFKDFSGNEFDATIDLVGIEYNLGGSANSFNQVDTSSRNPSFGLYSTCSTTTLTKGSSFVLHKKGGCIGEYGFIGERRIEPFKFYRPGINLPDLEEKIKGLPSGRYTANVFLTPFYLYKSESGVMSQTQMLEPITILVDYVAAELESVYIVSGDGVIEPKYDKVNHTVSGETYYEVGLLGNLPTGAVMKFVDFESDFNMISQVDNNEKLPFSFSCVQGCNIDASQNIILDGKFNRSLFPNGEILIPSNGSNTNYILTKYRIHYDISEDKVISSSYHGVINLIYEVNL